MENIYDNRRFVIFNMSEIGLINFDEVEETSSDTVRLSIDGSKTFVKYDGTMPASISSLTTRSQEYTYDEMLSILSGDEWTSVSIH